jgi:hypothetical protein
MEYQKQYCFKQVTGLLLATGRRVQKNKKWAIWPTTMRTKVPFDHKFIKTARRKTIEATILPRPKQRVGFFYKQEGNPMRAWLEVARGETTITFGRMKNLRQCHCCWQHIARHCHSDLRKLSDDSQGSINS